MSLSWNESEYRNDASETQAPEPTVSSRLKLSFGPPDAWGFICPTCKGFVPLCFTHGVVHAHEPRPEIPGPVALCCPTCRGGDLFTPADLCLGRSPEKTETASLDS